MQDNKTVHLVNSTYNAEDATEVLFSLINDKVRFLNAQILSRDERFGDECTHLKHRREQLKEAKDTLADMFADAIDKGLDIKIECPINISFVEKQDAEKVKDMAEA